MALKGLEAVKSKIGSFYAGLRDNRPGALPAVVVLVMLGLTLLFFDIAGKLDTPTIETGNKKVSEDQNNLKRALDNPLHSQLGEMIEAAKKKPFKAKVTTEGGFKGYWTQNGANYRFEDPLKSSIIIINSSKNKLWVIDVPGKVAHETPINASKTNSNNEIIAALFIEGLSTENAAVTKRLEDVLPGGKDAKLTFTPQGLPDRWDGSRSDGAKCFIDWEYIQLDNIQSSEFELPQGLTASKAIPDATPKGTN